MTPPPIRLLIADDHMLVRESIRALLTTEAGIEVVGEAGTGPRAVEQAAALQPDVILMDLMMPEIDGIEATRRITAQFPHIKILVLTSFDTDNKIFPALKAGALGYLLKSSTPGELAEAIRQTARGDSSLHPTVARRVLQEVSHTRPSTASQRLTDDPLTPREVEVLRLIAQGLDNKEIGTRLSISDGTVRTHIGNILSKLHLAGRTQAALYALREGLASIEDVRLDEEP